MDIEEAVDAVCVINPKVVFPMHQSKQNPAVIKREVVLCPAMLSTIHCLSIQGDVNKKGKGYAIFTGLNFSQPSPETE